MPDLKHCLPCKILAVVLCLFLAVEFHYLQAQNVTPAESFAIAMQDFNGGDFGRAKTRLEDIIDAADRVSAAESDLGYVYLMMGACDEMSGDLESGIRNYEQAEVLLGGCAAMIDGVELAGLPMYEFVFGPLQEESQAEDFEARLAEAMESYQAGEYEAAQAALEELAEDLASLEGMDTLRGETFLLLGASCEMLGLRSLAVEHYCQAKDILGSGKSTEGLDLATLPLYRENCTTTSGVAVTVLLAQYENGRDAYFAEDYEAAKLSLENLVSALETMEGWESFKGETYLVLGATYEKLNYKELAVKYFCKAKEILGVNKTIEGLELKTLKYYKELCDRVAALAGARKKGGIGKILGTLLGLALLGGAVWYLFFSPNAPFKKKKEEAPGPVGDYTSITVKLEVEYSGKNSKGNRKLYVDSQLKNNNSFLYPQPANDLTCTGTTKKENKSWQLTTTNKKLEITQEYNNWDYFSYGIGTNRKVLCATYTMSVVKYTFSGGSDPGSPTISGLDQLDINVNQDCTAVSQRVHNCEISADITFAKPANTKDAQQSSTVTVTSFRESR